MNGWGLISISKLASAYRKKEKTRAVHVNTTDIYPLVAESTPGWFGTFSFKQEWLWKQPHHGSAAYKAGINRNPSREKKT